MYELIDDVPVTIVEDLRNHATEHMDTATARTCDIVLASWLLHGPSCNWSPKVRACGQRVLNILNAPTAARTLGYMEI